MNQRQSELLAMIENNVNNLCRICKSNTQNIYTLTVLKKYQVDYHHCPSCGFIQTDNPFWLEEAYNESINDTDTGYMARNQFLSKKVSLFSLLECNVQGKFLDYAGGYGVFVRLMRDVGVDFYWDDKYTKNLFSKGFEYIEQEKVEMITTFESFEHFVDPILEIESMLGKTDCIYLSTDLINDDILPEKDWWYFGLEHGQHISFYSRRTFITIAEKYNLNVEFLNGTVVLSKRKVRRITRVLDKLLRFIPSSLIFRFFNTKTWADHVNIKNRFE